MNALIFLAHGSRRQKSNDEVRALVDAIRPLLKSKYCCVDAAFLEITTPSLRDVVDGLLERSVRSITVYPYFLNSGSHVDRDIPELIEDYRAGNPDCAFRVMRHFGGSEAIIGLVTRLLLQTRDP